MTLLHEVELKEAGVGFEAAALSPKITGTPRTVNAKKDTLST